MVKNNYTRRTCRLCHNRALTTVLKLAPTPLADAYVPQSKAYKPQQSYPLILVLCKKCGHVQIQDIIHPESIYINYIYETVSSLGLVDHFSTYAQQVVQQIKPCADSLVVDIGSNDGTLLKEFKKWGFRVLGIDPAKKIARLATQSGVETIPKFFTPQLAKIIRNTYGSASVITANNVFANIDDIDEFIHSVKTLLSTDGVFIVETSYLLDVIRHMVFDSIYHEHVSYFSVRPLVSFFHTRGMEIIDVTRVATKGGSIRVTVQRIGGPRKISSRVARLVGLETNIGLQKINIFMDFAAKITNAKTELHALVQNLRKQKKTFAGFGASNTSTTLMYHFQLQHSFPYLLDDNPRKHFTFSPGAHIPVLPSRAIYERKPDYIVILAWRYAKPIIAHHKRYLQDGGHFIVPLPKLQIL